MKRNKIPAGLRLKIRRMYRVKRLSQELVAELLGVSPDTVHRCVKGLKRVAPRGGGRAPRYEGTIRDDGYIVTAPCDPQPCPTCGRTLYKKPCVECYAVAMAAKGEPSAAGREEDDEPGGLDHDLSEEMEQRRKDIINEARKGQPPGTEHYGMRDRHPRVYAFTPTRNGQALPSATDAPRL